MLTRLCDKCAKPIDGEALKEEGAPPDFAVFLRGESVLEYDDICSFCEERLTQKIEQHLAVRTRRRKGEDAESA